MHVYDEWYSNLACIRSIHISDYAIDCIFMQERILNQFCIGRYEVHSDYYKYASAHFISRSFDINKVIMRKVVGKDVVIEEDLGLVVQLWLNQNPDLKAGQSGQKYPAGRMLIWQKQKANNENSSIRSTKKSSRHCHVVKGSDSFSRCRWHVHDANGL